MQLLVIIADIHGSTGKHVGRTYQYGIAYLSNKLLDIVERSQGAPSRLVDAQLVKHGRELVAVLCTIDVYR